MRFRFLPLCAAAALLVLTGCTVELYHGLPEQDANDIYVLLQNNGINATKTLEEGGNEPTFMIAVPKADAFEASKLMKKFGLPRPRTKGLGIFAQTKGMIPTATEERAMFLEAVAGEVSQALRTIDGVLDARAIVNIPESNDLAVDPAHRPKNSASVVVKYMDTHRPEDLTEEKIKKFVAGAVPDISPQNVEVIFIKSNPVEFAVSNNEESQLKTVLGLRVHAASANTFRLMVAGGGLAILAMAGFTAMSMFRGGSSSSSSRSRSRPRPEA